MQRQRPTLRSTTALGAHSTLVKHGMVTHSTLVKHTAPCILSSPPLQRLASWRPPCAALTLAPA